LRDETVSREEEDEDEEEKKEKKGREKKKSEGSLKFWNSPAHTDAFRTTGTHWRRHTKQRKRNTRNWRGC
jgi:hypothetical protein